MATEPSGAQTVLRALDILECFVAGESSALTLSQISERVRLTTPTTHRLLKALMSRQLVVIDGDRRYRLGPGLMRLASSIMRRDDLVAVAYPALERLRGLSGETVSLQALVGWDRVCIAELVSQSPIRMETGVGQVYPLWMGGAGKALLAWLPDDTVGRILDGARPPGGKRALLAELKQVREQGYATSVSEVVAGAASLAVPLFGPDALPVATINVTGPEARWTPARMEQHIPKVKGEADAIMRSLGSPMAAAAARARPAGRAR